MCWLWRWRVDDEKIADVLNLIHLLESCRNGPLCNPLHIWRKKLLNIIISISWRGIEITISQHERSERFEMLTRSVFIPLCPPPRQHGSCGPTSRISATQFDNGRRYYVESYALQIQSHIFLPFELNYSTKSILPAICLTTIWRNPQANSV